MKLGDTFGSLVSRFRALPRAVLAGIAVGIVALAAVGTYYGYRTYDYVQHDNDFCLSCHLMQQPYEKFARSAHRGLGCKACHRPTPVARARMGLTQIVRNPNAIEEHAAVPNETCEECHVRGNPREWRLIAASAGHRLHFESKEPSLRGLKCVECHSTSLHEFAAVDKTCGQAGCHENVRIQLGKMSNLTLHCAVCHDFSRPAPPDSVRGDSLSRALLPRSQECLSCHAMRRLVGESISEDPHRGVCGTCHNPHKQKTPAEAAGSCAESGCHEKPDTITPMHRGLAPDVLQDCATCHIAHTFTAEGLRCIDCHTRIESDDPTPRPPGAEGRTSPHPQPRVMTAPPARASRRSSSTAATGWVRLASLTQATTPEAELRETVPQQEQPGRQQGSTLSRFKHSGHRGVACETCHDSRQEHGALSIRTTRDCQSCHHASTASARCTNCHAPAEFRNLAIRTTQTFRSTADQRVRTRAVSFSHARHDAVACTRCHSDPLTRSAETLRCDACHSDHHKPDNDCRACHPAPPSSAHPARVVHTTCTGSGCHASPPIRGIPRTREFCISCHQDLVRHQAPKNCVDCHVLPERGARPSRPASGGGT